MSTKLQIVKSVACLASVVALGLSLSYAHAQGHPGADRRQFREVRQQPHTPPPQQYTPPPRPAQGQMSAEERRRLHQDLDKANRELYAPRR